MGFDGARGWPTVPVLAAGDKARYAEVAVAVAKDTGGHATVLRGLLQERKHLLFRRDDAISNWEDLLQQVAFE